MPSSVARVPTARFPGLVFTRRGSLWRLTYEDPSRWPLALYARDIYYGTGRILATLVLDREDLGLPNPTRILAKSVDMMSVGGVKNFAKEAASRLNRSDGRDEAAHADAITTMLDAMQERLMEARGEIVDSDVLDIEMTEDLGPRYVLSPLILRGRPSVLVAPAGNFKSTVATMIALSVCSGTPLLPGLEVKEQGPVLYINNEEEPEDQRKRVERILRGHSLKIDRHLLRIMRLKNDSLIESADVISERIEAHKATLVIVDSAQATWGRGEQAGVREYASRWYNTAGSLGAPVLIIEHPNLFDTKQGQNGSGFAAGTSVKFDRVGRQITQKTVRYPTPEGSPARVHVTLSDKKNSYDAPMPDMTFEIVFGGHQWIQFREADAMNVDAIVSGGTQLAESIAQFMLKATDRDPKAGWTKDELAEQLGRSERSIQNEVVTVNALRPASWKPGWSYQFVRVTSGGGRGNQSKFTVKLTPDPQEPLSLELPGNSEMSH